MADRLPFKDLRAHYGTRSEIEFDDLNKTVSVITHFDDVDPLLDLNAAKRSAGRDYYAADKEMWKAATIPVAVQMKWLTQYGVDVYNPDHEKKVRQLLNSPDYRYLKTAEIIL